MQGYGSLVLERHFRLQAVADEWSFSINAISTNYSKYLETSRRQGSATLIVVRDFQDVILDRWRPAAFLRRSAVPFPILADSRDAQRAQIPVLCH